MDNLFFFFNFICFYILSKKTKKQKINKYLYIKEKENFLHIIENIHLIIEIRFSSEFKKNKIFKILNKLEKKFHENNLFLLREKNKIKINKNREIIKHLYKLSNQLNVKDKLNEEELEMEFILLKHLIK